MSGHTKGPWNRSSLASLYIIQGDDSSPICSMGEYSKRGRVETTFENAHANARLIAAAPELLEALEDLVEAIPHQTSDADWWPDELTHAIRAARAAIAKAEVSQ